MCYDGPAPEPLPPRASSLKSLSFPMYRGPIMTQRESPLLKPADPYADLAAVIAEETSHARIAVRPTPKTQTEENEKETPDGGAFGMSIVS